MRRVGIFASRRVHASRGGVGVCGVCVSGVCGSETAIGGAVVAFVVYCVRRAALSGGWKFVVLT